MAKTIIYVRQSKSREVQVHSAQYQEDACRQYWDARQRKLPPVERVIVDEDVSGRVHFSQREGGRILLEIAERGDVVIFWHIDRLGRDAMDIICTVNDLQTRGLDVRIANYLGEGLSLNSGHGVLILSAFACMAQFERERISERNLAVADWLRRNGRTLNGTSPYGKRVLEKHVVPCPRDSQRLEVMKDMYRRGFQLHEIAEFCNQQRWRTSKGRKWKIQNLSNVLSEAGVVRSRRPRNGRNRSTAGVTKP
jgi:DNA invertase Pin-like site-specific DNA recombinase